MNRILDLEPIGFKSLVLEYITGCEDPVGIKNILKGIGLPNGDRQYLRGLLTEMVKDGALVKRGSQFWIPEGKTVAKQIKRGKQKEKKSFSGLLSVAKQGYGFVAMDRGPDWFIPGHAMGNAMHGDTVRVERTEKSEGRVVGRIVEVESPGMTQVLGVFSRRDGRLSFYPFGKMQVSRENLIGVPQDAPEGGVGLFQRNHKDKLVFKTMLGSINDPAIDERVVLAEYGIRTSFPVDVEKQAAGFSADYRFEPGDRRDFRDELVFTIDGATARDFDDALHFKRLPKGITEVGVHIADVSHFVTPGSPMDLWASQQGNSVYLPHKAFPMLPEILSNELCSLKPNVDRYTTSVVVQFDAGMNIKDVQITKGIIHSAFRLTYQQVYEMSVSKTTPVPSEMRELAERLAIGFEIAATLRKKRREQGGLALEMGERALVLDSEQVVEQVDFVFQNEANHLIETFMCLANECVARFFSGRGVSIPYRIHDVPDPERFERFLTFIQAYGVTIPHALLGKPAQIFNAVIDQLKDREDGDLFQIQLLKTLKLAEYSTHNVGHFGLGSADYAHFTSPIRRYADLVIHQRLTQILAKPGIGPEYFDDKGLDDICRQISKKERDAAGAEKTFSRLKLLRHLKELGARVMDGMVVEVKASGLMVELDGLHLEGMIPLAYLDDDFYQFNETLLMLNGTRTGKEYRLGSKVKVRVDRVDLIRRQVDLGFADRPVGRPRPVMEKRAERGHDRRDGIKGHSHKGSQARSSRGGGKAKQPAKQRRRKR